MFNWIKENSFAFVIALICHIIVLALLLVNWQMDQPKQIVLQQGNIVQVTAIDANSYQAEIDKIEQKKAAEKRQAKEQQRKKTADEKKRKAAIKKAQQKKQRKRVAQKKKEAEEKRKRAQRKKAQREKLLREKEQLKKKQLEENERLKNEQRKKAEQEKHHRAEKKKLQKAEKKRKAEAKRKEDAQRQIELKRQAEQEKAARERRSKGIINRHVALITDKIKRNWRQPLGIPDGLQCRIDIVLLPDGRVVSVNIFESSGNPAFDRSVKNSVRKSSPLPVPADSVIFKQFETMRLRFDPGSY